MNFGFLLTDDNKTVSELFSFLESSMTSAKSDKQIFSTHHAEVRVLSLEMCELLHRSHTRKLIHGSWKAGPSKPSPPNSRSPDWRHKEGCLHRWPLLGPDDSFVPCSSFSSRLGIIKEGWRYRWSLRRGLDNTSRCGESTSSRVFKRGQKLRHLVDTIGGCAGISWCFFPVK